MDTRRFVVLRHEPGPLGSRELHWDLMLEFGDGLRTWALSSELHIGKEIAAEELPIHRVEYLDYEGPISNERGKVTRVARGKFTVQADTKNRLEVVLHDDPLAGCLRILHDSGNQRCSVLLTPN
ncbi:MAG: hypothetical protein KDB11_11710 [Planctomycetales bacterium]|nr:hypothetical protein [Planctomycetales bacterium]